MMHFTHKNGTRATIGNTADGVETRTHFLVGSGTVESFDSSMESMADLAARGFELAR